jgi:hypothetical protein
LEEIGGFETLEDDVGDLGERRLITEAPELSYFDLAEADLR